MVLLTTQLLRLDARCESDHTASFKARNARDTRLCLLAYRSIGPDVSPVGPVNPLYRTIRWVRPQLRVEVEYAGWSGGIGPLLHGTISLRFAAAAPNRERGHVARRRLPNNLEAPTGFRLGANPQLLRRCRHRDARDLQVDVA